MLTKPNKNRIDLIDEIRGFAILCMVLYHAVFDVILLFGISFPFFFSGFMNTTRDIFAGTFILISGAACRLSRNNLKRGVICFLLGMAMTLATWLVMPEELIVFGILHMLGISMILFSFLRPLLDRIPPVILAAAFIAFIIITSSLPAGKLNLFWLSEIKLPDILYQSNWLSPLGFYNEFFRSGDYFPLIPWIFVFLLGSIIGVPLKERKFPPFFYQSHIPALAWIGRNTIYIYLIHQPVIFGILSVIQALSSN